MREFGGKLRVEYLFRDGEQNFSKPQDFVDISSLEIFADALVNSPSRQLMFR